MINDLKTDQSKLDYTISGLDLRPVQIRILMKVTETNQTLKGLSMARKKICDEDGVELVKSLEKNQVLERFEMEGNLMGSKTALAIGNMLTTNRSLRYLFFMQNNSVIDLENNNLLSEDNQGALLIAEALRTNDSLLSLNLNNTNLDEKAGSALV